MSVPAFIPGKYHIRKWNHYKCHYTLPLKQKGTAYVLPSKLTGRFLRFSQNNIFLEHMKILHSTIWNKTLRVLPFFQKCFIFLQCRIKRATIFNIFVFYLGCVQHAKPSFTWFLSPKPLVCLLTWSRSQFHITTDDNVHVQWYWIDIGSYVVIFSTVNGL